MALLEVKDLHTFFTTKRGIVKAVNGVSYSVEAGRMLGIVGESGCGKSVSAMSILKLLDENGYIDSGSVKLEGRELLNLTRNEMYQIRGNDISVIFQEPMTSLNPVHTVERQIGESFLIHQNMNKRQAYRNAQRMLLDVKIPNPDRVAKQYPFQLSGGMRQRVMIAMALACEPRILIADEPTTALDVTIQAQILELIRELQSSSDTSVILITHDLGVVAEMADEVAVMYAKKIVETTDVETLFDEPLHPYTKGLMGSVPVLGDPRPRLEAIPGTVPNLTELSVGCRFASRCQARIEAGLTVCQTHHPDLVEVRPGHAVRCWLYSGQEVAE